MVASSVSAYYLCQELGMIGGACLGGAVEGGVFRQLLQKNGLGSEVSSFTPFFCKEAVLMVMMIGGEGSVE